MTGNIDLDNKVKELRKDPDSVEWLANIGSDSAKINYLKHLAEYLAYRNISVNIFIENFEKDPKTETKKVNEFVNFLLNRTEPRPLKPSSVGNYVSAIKSRLKYDGIQIVREIKIKDRHYHETVSQEITPDVEKVENLIRNSKPSTQTSVVLIAYLGLRFKAIAGIKVRDFPEMKITTEKEIVFEKLPTRVRIRPELNKGKKRGYETFLVEKGCKILKNWLQVRIQSGEDITSESLIIPTDCKNKSYRRSSNAISRRFYTVFKKIDFGTRPYSLKGFFATCLRNSGIQQNYQTFFMGHTGLMQNEYTDQRQFSTKDIEIMRNLFKEKIEPCLVPDEKDGERQINQTMKNFGKKMGAEIKEEDTTDDAISKLVEEIHAEADRKTEEMQDLFNQELKQIKKTQKIIPESELEKHMQDGWTYRDNLRSGNVIIERGEINEK